MSGQDIVPIDPPVQALQTIRRNEAKVARGFWSKLKRSVGRVPFLEEAVSAYYCAFDPQTPRRVKALLLAALAYFVVPSDMIPDFVAGLGFSDDATVLFAAIRMVSGHIGERHHLAARRRLAELGLRDETAAGSPADRPVQGA
ncbi:MAG: YkvA family protein [Bacteroidota bacterium]|nr:YkvA family protein [Kiloniellaceae bacterium]